MTALLAILAASLAVATAATAKPASPLLSVTSTSRFELRSDARVALHHFLIDWATADAGAWPPYALPLAEREGWDTVLTREEARIWSAAVATYTGTSGRSLVFDEGMVAVRDWAAGDAPETIVPAADRSIAEALAAALPVYERRWWPAHHERNRRWIASVAPVLDEVEDEIIARFEAAYGGRWPAARVPVDVMVYTNPVGAYSAAGRLTVSSAYRGNEMPQALEMVFHEASHTDEAVGDRVAGP